MNICLSRYFYTCLFNVSVSKDNKLFPLISVNKKTKLKSDIKSIMSDKYKRKEMLCFDCQCRNSNPQSTSIYYKNVQTLPWKQSERHIHEHDSLLSSCASMFVLNSTPVPTGEICNGGGQFPQNCSF